MGDFCKIKRECGFYISNVHLSMMILPYINKVINEDKKVIIFTENNIENIVKQILAKWKIKEDEKEKILEMNWQESIVNIYSNVEKILKENINEENDINIFVGGTEKYISIANENITTFVKNNSEKLEYKRIKIINCYEVTEFNKNLKEILDVHDMIFNTSGEHDIGDIFEEYKRKTV